jgi:hypothetical protein
MGLRTQHFYKKRSQSREVRHALSIPEGRQTYLTVSGLTSVSAAI